MVSEPWIGTYDPSDPNAFNELLRATTPDWLWPEIQEISRQITAQNVPAPLDFPEETWRQWLAYSAGDAGGGNMRYYVEQQADGWYAVNQYAPEGWDWVGPYSTQQLAEDAAHQWETTGAKPGAGPAGGGTAPTGNDAAAIAEFLKLAGNDPNQQALVTRLRNGTYTAEDLRGANGVYAQLTAAGWGGAGGAGGGAGGTATMPAQFPYQVQLAIAEMENAIAKAQQALAERRFQEYDMAILTLNQAESELNRQLQVAGVTGYYEGQPTFNRLQWEATIQQQEAQRLMQEAGITGQYQGAPTLQTQQLQEQIRQFDTNATLARQQAEAAIRQGDEQLALQSQAQAQQYEIQSQQLQQQLAQITGVYGGAPTLEAQQLQAQIAQFDQQIVLARQQADEARRQFNEGLAWQKEQEVMQLQFQRDQLAQQATQFGQTLGFQQQQLQAQISQFDQQIALAHQQAAEATRQFDYTLAWQKEQQASELQWQRDQLAQQLEYQRQIATGYIGEQPTLEREQAIAGLTGYYQGQPTFEREQYVAQQARAPGDWLTYLATLRGGLTPEMIPPSTQAIMAGQPLPGYQGITPAPRVPGTTGIMGQPPMAGQPMRLPSTQAWYGMTPAEQEAHQAVVELQGIPWREYQAQFEAQAPGTPYPTMGW